MNLVSHRPQARMHPAPFSSVLAGAADASRLLEAAGVEIVSTYANGRQIVLHVETPPAGVAGAVKRQHPNGWGGVTRVYAAPFHGCQLQWMTDSANEPEVPRG